MLVIRMQRTGRKGHAMFRVVVQDSRRTPTSGKIVAALGSYDPHTKTNTLNKEKAQTYLNNGAQPSDRVVKLLEKEGITLPTWVKQAQKQEGKIRNPEKLRRNQPKEEAVEETEETTSGDEAVADISVDDSAETVATDEETASK